MEESKDLFRDIEKHLRNPKPEKSEMSEPLLNTEAEQRRNKYRKLTQTIFTVLGHQKTVSFAREAIEGTDVLRSIAERLVINLKGFDQKTVKFLAEDVSRIPNSEAAANLLKTAIFGIPLKSGEDQDVVAEFPLAERSVAKAMNEIKATGQSKIFTKPNFEGTQVLLRTLLKETGFLPEVPTGTLDYGFGNLKSKLKSSGQIELTHQGDNRLKIKINKPTGKVDPQTPLSWAYNIQITYNH